MMMMLYCRSSFGWQNDNNHRCRLFCSATAAGQDDDGRHFCHRQHCRRRRRDGWVSWIVTSIQMIVIIVIVVRDRLWSDIDSRTSTGSINTNTIVVTTTFVSSFSCHRPLSRRSQRQQRKGGGRRQNGGTSHGNNNNNNKPPTNRNLFSYDDNEEWDDHSSSDGAKNQYWIVGENNATTSSTVHVESSTQPNLLVKEIDSWEWQQHLNNSVNDTGSRATTDQETIRVRNVLESTRGGGGSSSIISISSTSTSNSNSNDSTRRVVYSKSQASVGKTNPIDNAIQYWKKVLQGTVSKAVEPFQLIPQKVSTVLRSQQERDEEQLMEKLRTTTIKKVVIGSKTSVVPTEVVDIAARSSNMIGHPLRTNTVQDFAEAIKRWYNRNGYVLHSVTGATLLADTGIAEIQVQEPTCSSPPVDITFVKEMILDDDTGELMTLRQYKERHTNRRSFGFTSDGTRSSSSSSNSLLDRNKLNVTYIRTNGRTKSNRIAEALQLQPYRSFRWQRSRWDTVASCGLFTKIYDASPRSLPDGSVQFKIIATEAPPRHLEYGLGKSLYTGIWEGEIDFEHTNLLGGGETIGISIKRQAPPSLSSISTSASVSATTTTTSSPSSSSTNTPDTSSAAPTATKKRNRGFFANMMTKNNNDNGGDNSRSNQPSNDDTTKGSNKFALTSSIQPSIRIKYSDGRLQQDGGYDVEIFREYLSGSNSIINNNAASAVVVGPRKDPQVPRGNSDDSGWSSRSRNAVAWFQRRRREQQQQQQQSVRHENEDNESNGDTHYDIYSTDGLGTAATDSKGNMDASVGELLPDSDTASSTTSTTSSYSLHDDDDVVAGGGSWDDDHNDDTDVLYNRKGATIRFNNPIDPNVVQNTVASASIEQTTTMSGYTESIGSTTWDIGPFVRELPLGARTNFDLTVTAGTRIARQRQRRRLSPQREVPDNDDNNDHPSNSSPSNEELQQFVAVNRGGGFMGRNNNNNNNNNSNHRLVTKVLPFSTISATTRHIFPLLDGSSNHRGVLNRNISRKGGNIGSRRRNRPVLLAFRHGVILSTTNIPRHTMQAHGTATTIRGSDGSCDPSGRVSSALQGTVEIRVPVRIPDIRFIRTKDAKFGFKLIRLKNNEDNDDDNNRNNSGEGTTTMITAGDAAGKDPTTPLTSAPASPRRRRQQPQDGSIVLFSDWAITTQDFTMTTVHHKSNIGLGLRKTISGLPIQYDICYIPKENKLKASFGLGKDFDF